MKIGGNQAEAFPDLPIQPRNIDFKRKTDNIAKEFSKKIAEHFFIRQFVHSFLPSRKAFFFDVFVGFLCLSFVVFLGNLLDMTRMCYMKIW